MSTNPLMDGLWTDVSFTLFLQPTDSYDGAELEIETVAGDDEIKLPAGHLVAYPSTALHRVAPVLRGERVVAVGWAQSYIRHPAQRELLFDLECARRRLFERVAARRPSSTFSRKAPQTFSGCGRLTCGADRHGEALIVKCGPAQLRSSGTGQGCRAGALRKPLVPRLHAKSVEEWVADAGVSSQVFECIHLLSILNCAPDWRYTGAQHMFIEKAAAFTLPVSRSLPSYHPGCPLAVVRDKLRQVGLRPTQQRISLGWLLFGKGDRHVTAEMLYDEALRAHVPVSLATIYNTLNQFTEAGLLRQLAVDGSKSYFDTNPTEHHHFFIEGQETLVDVPADAVSICELPQPPDGMEIASVEVIVRLRPARSPRPGPLQPSATIAVRPVEAATPSVSTV